jgi:hypothetical protein
MQSACARLRRAEQEVRTPVDRQEFVEILLDAIDDAKAIPARHLRQGSGNMLLNFRNDVVRWKATTKSLLRTHLGRDVAREFDLIGDPEIPGPTWPLLEEIIAKYDAYLSALAERLRVPTDASASGAQPVSSPMHAAVAAFCSYASKDDSFREALQIRMAMLERQGLVTMWHFRQLEPGVEWDAEIRKQLAASQLILLLVSPDFLSSRYSWDEEVRVALKRHAEGSARVVPIILRPCDWMHEPLQRLQALPRDGKPITQWPDPDEAWQDVIDGLRRVIASLTTARPNGTMPSA